MPFGTTVILIDVDDNGSWYPVVAFRPTPDYTLIFNSNIGSDFYEDSEGDRVNVYYPPGILKSRDKQSLG